MPSSFVARLFHTVTLVKCIISHHNTDFSACEEPANGSVSQFISSEQIFKYLPSRKKNNTSSPPIHEAIQGEKSELPSGAHTPAVSESTAQPAHQGGETLCPPTAFCCPHTSELLSRALQHRDPSTQQPVWHRDWSPSRVGTVSTAPLIYPAFPCK